MLTAHASHARFAEQHRAALRYPVADFHYTALPPAGARFDIQAARKGELQHAVVPFSTDPYGCGAPTLTAKRTERNPYLRSAPYPLSAPEMAGLLKWCGPSLYKGRLPWDPVR